MHKYRSPGVSVQNVTRIDASRTKLRMPQTMKMIMLSLKNTNVIAKAKILLSENQALPYRDHKPVPQISGQ